MVGTERRGAEMLIERHPEEYEAGLRAKVSFVRVDEVRNCNSPGEVDDGIHSSGDSGRLGSQACRRDLSHDGPSDGPKREKIEHIPNNTECCQSFTVTIGPNADPS